MSRSTSTHLSRYEGPTEIIRKYGKSWVYDAGSGELIAELTEAAATMVRNGIDGTLTLKGGHIDVA